MKFTMTLAVSVEPTEEDVTDPMKLRKKMLIAQRVKAFVTVSQILCVTDGGLF